MNNNRYKILCIEDEENITRFLAALLEANGYQVLTASSCREGQLVYDSHRPDLVILDLGLPDQDGRLLIRELRKTDATPVIVLSARSEESDKVETLDLGANDYVTKPFGSAELLARIRSILRNNRQGNEAGRLPGGTFTCRDLTIEYDSRRIIQAGEEVRLTQTEYNIIVLLAQHSGKVMTYAAIIREVWGGSDIGSVKKLQVNMANIRRKLHVNPGDNRYFVNELGVGYRMMASEE